MCMEPVSCHNSNLKKKVKRLVSLGLKTPHLIKKVLQHWKYICKHDFVFYIIFIIFTNTTSKYLFFLKHIFLVQKISPATVQNLNTDCSEIWSHRRKLWVTWLLAMFCRAFVLKLMTVKGLCWIERMETNDETFTVSGRQNSDYIFLFQERIQCSPLFISQRKW
jgi:hypothetical protein